MLTKILRISLFFLMTICFSSYSLDPYTVRVVYFMPTDSANRSDALDLDTIMKSIQSTYRDEMERHGFSDKTFRLETNNIGKVIVHKVKGNNNKSFYRKDNTLRLVHKELESQGYNDRQSIYAVVMAGMTVLWNGAAGLAATSPLGAWYNNNEYYGYCVNIETTKQGTESILRHEIGHVFGLSHLVLDNPVGFIMANGDKLAFHEARWLSKNQYFNDIWRHNFGPEIFRFHGAKNQNDGKIRITADITDADGLFQSYGFVNTPTPAGFGVIGYNFYEGDVKASIDFGDIDRHLLTSSDKIWLQLMDIHGNWRYHHPNTYTLPKVLDKDLDIDLTEGIVAYWDFNGNSDNTVKDVSGNGHEGRLIGGTERIKEGKYGGALKFNGINSEVSIPYHENLNPERFTITAWVKADQNGNGYRAVVSSRNDFPQRGYILYCSVFNTWQFWIGTKNNHWRMPKSTPVNFEKWDHLAGTYEDGKQRFYVNGVFLGESNFHLSVNPDQEFLIGAGANELSNHHYRFLGVIDEVRLYNYVLDKDEIVAVMHHQSLDGDQSDENVVNEDQEERELEPPNKIDCPGCNVDIHEEDATWNITPTRKHITTSWAKIKTSRN